MAGAPLNGTVEIAGPEQFHLDELLRRNLAALRDPREVVSDSHARFFGGELSERTLVPDNDARLGGTSFESWQTQPPREVSKTRRQRRAGPGLSQRLIASSKSVRWLLS